MEIIPVHLVNRNLLRKFLKYATWKENLNLKESQNK